VPPRQPTAVAFAVVAWISAVAIERREQVDHWEAGSGVGKGNVRLITPAARDSHYTKLKRVADGKAQAAPASMLAAMHSIDHCVGKQQVWREDSRCVTCVLVPTAADFSPEDRRS